MTFVIMRLGLSYGGVKARYCTASLARIILGLIWFAFKENYHTLLSNTASIMLCLWYLLLNSTFCYNHHIFPRLTPLAFDRVLDLIAMNGVPVYDVADFAGQVRLVDPAQSWKVVP